MKKFILVERALLERLLAEAGWRRVDRPGALSEDRAVVVQAQKKEPPMR